VSRRAGWLAVALLAGARPARAHHGGATGGFLGAEGPGAGIETTSALPLPEQTLLLLAKTEYARFRHLDRAEPFNKDHVSFTTLGVGYGVTPWLTAYAFAPWAVKAQDGIGTSSGPGDPSVLLALGFKWDEGLRLVPEKESLDELADWHFSVWGATSIPLGSVSRRDARGEYFEPEMQSGFGAPSVTAGVAALKQLSRTVTLLADASLQRFFPHTYAFTRYEFGAETRAGLAAAWRALARPGLRLDVVGELSGLDLERDREAGAAGALEPLGASGGAILYAGVGVRAALGRVGLALALKRAALTALHEAARQQGSEGLEVYRATAVVTWAMGL
jgi:hypothetical protein